MPTTNDKDIPSKAKLNRDDIINSFNEKYPMSPDFIHCTEYIQSICQDYPDLTNTAYYYLIGKRYRTDTTSTTKNRSIAEILDDYSTAYNINRSTIYAYSVFSKHLDIIRSKSESCFIHLILENLHHNYRNIKRVSDMSENELTELCQYIEANPDNGSYAEIALAIQRIKKIPTASAQKKKQAKQKKEIKKQEDLPIKKLPAFDPDAELSSLAFTIPSWISSIKRTRKNTKISQTSAQTRNQLRNQLSELEDAITLMLLFINEEDLNNGK